MFQDIRSEHSTDKQETPFYDEEMRRRYNYAQDFYKRYSIEKIYKHLNHPIYCIEFKPSQKAFTVFGYSNELSIQEPDIRMKTFENALAKDIATFEYIMEKPLILKLLLVMTSNRQVKQLYRQKYANLDKKMSERGEYTLY